MAIQYPIALPTRGRLSTLFRAVSVVARTRSPFTGQMQVQVHPGQWWEVDVTLVPMRRETAEAWIAALLALNGSAGTCLFGDRAGRTPRGTGGGAPQVDGAGQTGQTLVTDGWTPSETVLKVGDWIQLGTTPAAQRLYRVIGQDVESDAQGRASITIFPALRESPADNEPLVLHDTAGLFRLATNTRAWSIDRALLYGVEFSLVEAI